MVAEGYYRAIDGRATCKHCGAVLQLEWHGGREDFERLGHERQETSTAS